MFHYALFAAFAAVVPLSCASTVSADFVLAQRSEEIEAVANSDSILEAFIEANHPAASPNRTMSEYGDFDMYMFDEEEWQGMRSSLLQKAGIDESAIVARELAVRQNNDPPQFNCVGLRSAPLAYNAKLSSAIFGICSVVVNGRTGYRYVFRRNMQDAHPPQTNVGFMRATFTFLAKAPKWAAGGACNLALGIGNTAACIYLEDTPEGEQQVHTGITAENSEVASSITFTDIPG